MTKQVDILTGMKYFLMKRGGVRGGVKDNPFFNKSEEYVKENKVKARNAYKNALNSYVLSNLLNDAKRSSVISETEDVTVIFDKISDARSKGWVPTLQIERELFRFKV